MLSNPAKKSSFLKNRQIKNRQIIISIILILFYSTIPAANAQNNGNLDLSNATGIIKATVIPVHPQTADPEKFIYELKPGTNVEDFIWLVNLSDKKNSIYLYPAYSEVTADGTISFSTDNYEKYEKKEISAWFILEEQIFTLEPKEWKKVPIKINIPAETAIGTYKGGFAIGKTLEANSNGVKSSFRKIINIEVKISDTAPEYQKNKLTFKPTIYFWTALGIFLLTVGYFLFSKKKSGKRNFKKLFGKHEK